MATELTGAWRARLPGPGGPVTGAWRALRVSLSLTLLLLLSLSSILRIAWLMSGLRSKDWRRRRRSYGATCSSTPLTEPGGTRRRRRLTIPVSIGPTIKPVPAVKSERPGTCEPIGCRSDPWNFGILGRRYFSTKSFDARGGGPVHRGGGGREDPER